VPDLVIERLPDLHDPVVVVAFTGWNDAASAATEAAKFLVDRMSGRRFAWLDAEQFYAFTDSRPTAAIVGGSRMVNWQKNEFFYVRNPAGAHDIVVGLGVEPSLRWKSFASAHADLYRQIGASLVVSLGALLADVPHTRPTRVTGTAADPEVAARLDLTTSRYQGPTGIVGVLHNILRDSGVAAASLWANTPHYITTSQNPPATSALLTRLQTLVDLRLDLRELTVSGERFVKEVDTALQANSEMAAYVRRLEQQYDQAPGPVEELPEASEVISDVESFLRGLRDS
jgi:proteasome assembly chaperone (PAC2) family protein